MSQKPRILITNDDGINAPGLKKLWEPVKDFADVFIVAPSTEQSGVGAGITFFKPVHFEKVKWVDDTPAWKVGGTPADCVKVAIGALLDSPPDLIISGVNKGSNAGRNVLYSGTVGGVIEGVLRKIPGIAFSYSDGDTAHYPHVKKFIPSLIKHFLEHPIADGTLMNVNFPHVADEMIKGYRMARQGKSLWIETPEINNQGDGVSHYHMRGKPAEYTEHSESDIYLLNKGYITVVPIHIDELTDHSLLKAHKPLFDELLNASFPPVHFQK
ncbi:MAG: 5'/3'-nucleotidase SurE [Simkaniaceae bacterium]|nr:5'/3'-nucleotidase SurE [Simkaniaceae bacterium]